MILLLIRHGESEADILSVHEGRADFALTPRGERQASAMAQYVAQKYAPGAVYCSTLRRARQTAQLLADECGVQPVCEQLLMEHDNGLLAGRDREFVREHYPLVENLPLHEEIYGQESALYFRYRADVALSKIISENEDSSTVAVVSHGGMINQLIRSILRLPVDSDISFATGDTGIHVWSIEGARRRLLAANYTAHTDKI